MRHLLRISDLELDEIDRILDVAASPALLGRARTGNRRVVCTFFETPSIRTRVGFSAAAALLGWQSVSVDERRRDDQMSGAESLEDTLRALSGMSAVLVVRTAASLPAVVADAACVCPVICAGDNYEHPTQALIDIAAMRRHCGDEQNLRIGLSGDLTMRAATSLIGYFNRRPPVELRLLAAPGRELSTQTISARLANVTTRGGPGDVGNLDVLYVVGLPPNRGGHHLDANARAPFIVNDDQLNALPRHATILSPLPVVDELSPAARADPRTRIWEQSDGAVAVRASVLDFLAAHDRD